MVRIQYVQYLCQSCRKPAMMIGTEPLKCRSCGRVCCDKCSPEVVCPVCMQFVSQDDKNELTALKSIKPSNTSLGCTNPSFCCGIMMVFLGIAVLNAPTGAHEVATTMTIIGAILIVLMGPLYFKSKKKLNIYAAQVNKYFSELVSRIHQRQVQAMQQPQNP